MKKAKREKFELRMQALEAENQRLNGIIQRYEKAIAGYQAEIRELNARDRCNTDYILKLEKKLYYARF